ncbi:tRNA pseudouridine(55) synthase TruB [Candidatus Ruminimicrobium bovinum]|uniref:tRNA pseudouridine(55) synthase TruB n=1 Tax=Candidatus Ruminimicrobium bovinum TaxID=3242779 RepID=UPI0039B8D683
MQNKPYNEYNGLLLVNKPSGITSFGLLKQIKKKLSVNKIGHCGTLDPLAKGLMLVLVGSATKKQDFFMKKDKVYKAKIKLGIKTDTGDMAGNIVATAGYEHITFDDIKKVCENFTGKIEQVPPMYSALKVNGKKLCDLARQGITVERKKRQITIYSIDILNFKDGFIEARIKCSSGTYIRTLAEDMGKALKTEAVLSGLVREQIDNWKLSNALTVDELTVDDIIHVV